MNPQNYKRLSFSLIALCIAVILCFSVIYKDIFRKPPNILFIVADDLGWGDVGWHGGFAKTPNMDALVAKGVELNRHYVYPSCTPTRAAIMSGLYPGSFGKNVLIPSNKRALPKRILTLPKLLKQQGYTTYISGKWGLGAFPAAGPKHYGFDYSFGTLAPAADPWTHNYRSGKFKDTWNENGVKITPEGNTTEIVARKALEYMQPQDKPWFVYVPFHAVHTPVDAPRKYKKLYRGIKFDPNERMHLSRRRLAAMISQMDDKIGEFVSLLKQTGQYDNTIIIFTSDNGGATVSHNPYMSFVPNSPLNSSNEPLRGGKGELYEGGTRMPAFIHFPKDLPAYTSNLFMHAVDWMPTLAALTGYTFSKDTELDGQNKWPYLKNPVITEQPKRTIYTALITDEFSLINSEGYKLLLQPSMPDELYNILEDPEEKNNIALTHPILLKQLKEQLMNERQKVRSRLN